MVVHPSPVSVNYHLSPPTCPSKPGGVSGESMDFHNHRHHCTVLSTRQTLFEQTEDQYVPVCHNRNNKSDNYVNKASKTLAGWCRIVTSDRRGGKTGCSNALVLTKILLLLTLHSWLTVNNGRNQFSLLRSQTLFSPFLGLPRLP